MKIIQINKPIQDLHAIEHDINTRFPTFQFKDGLKPYDLSNCTVRVYGVNSLVKPFFNDLEIINAKQGIARLELTDTMLVKGITKMQFVIMPSSGGQLKTYIFNLINGESLVDSEAIEGTNEYKVFENALKKLDTLIATGDETNKTLAYNIEQAKPLSQELSTKISNAESTKSELMNKTQEGNGLKESLTSLNAEAKSTKSELEQAISTGDIATMNSEIQKILGLLGEVEIKKSLNNGYFKIGGLILQWGYISNVTNGYFVTLPIPLNNKDYNIQITCYGGSGGTTSFKAYYQKENGFNIEGGKNGYSAFWHVISWQK